MNNKDNSLDIRFLNKVESNDILKHSYSISQCFIKDFWETKGSYAICIGSTLKQGLRYITYVGDHEGWEPIMESDFAVSKKTLDDALYIFLEEGASKLFDLQAICFSNR